MATMSNREHKVTRREFIKASSAAGVGLALSHYSVLAEQAEEEKPELSGPLRLRTLGRTGLKVTDIGFVDHPMIESFGASPDGLVSDGRCLEIKCPKTATHLGYILDDVVPDQYKPQMCVQAACTGRPVWFVSFDPRMPANRQLFIKLYEPSESEINQVEEQAKQFLWEVDELFDRITSEEV